MSLWDHSSWKGGFPFTPTRLRPQGRGVKGQGGDIDVTAAHVPDAGTHVPRRDESQVAPVQARIVLPDAMAVRVVPASRRFAPRAASLRLLPLAAFSWGSRSLPAQPRTRPEHVLVWVTEGRMRLDFPRRSVVMEPGDIRYIPAGTAFAAKPQQGAQGHVLLVSPELTAEVDPPLPTSPTAGCAGKGAAALLGTLRELVEEATNAPDRKALNCHLNLLSLRLTRLDPTPDHRPAAGPALPDRSLVEQFLTLAAAELGNCRTLADQAQDLGTTLTQLDRACIEAKGRRAVELMHELRLERAVEMLRHTDRTPARIAQELGYASQTHLTRAFVDATGRTPEAYRLQMR